MLLFKKEKEKKKKKKAQNGVIFPQDSKTRLNYSFSLFQECDL